MTYKRENELPNDSKPRLGDLTQGKLQRELLRQQCWNNVVTLRNNVAAMLQRCAAMKIVGTICHRTERKKQTQKLALSGTFLSVLHATTT